MKDVENLVKELRVALQPWRAFLIAIDGRDGVGKSPLGRRLAWELNVPLIETDLYLAESDGRPEYHLDELNRVIQSRICLNRPVIVEGVFIRQLLKLLGLQPEYVIHVTRPECEGSHSWEAAFARYEAEFPPPCANQQVSWSE